MKLRYRKKIYLFILLSTIVNVNCKMTENDEIMKTVENIQWLGQAAVKIKTENLLIYVDPYKLKNGGKADIILITHKHHDHLSIEDIKKITTYDTRIIAPADCLEALKQCGSAHVYDIEPGKSLKIKDIGIEAVYAYNVIKKSFHPKGKNFVGYIIETNNVSIYHTGDTERIPEMKDISCDIILIPLGQTYTMNSVEEAAEAVIDTRAKVAIPIHYGLYEGKKEDAEKLKKLLNGKVNVVLKD